AGIEVHDAGADAGHFRGHGGAQSREPCDQANDKHDGNEQHFNADDKPSIISPQLAKQFSHIDLLGAGERAKAPTSVVAQHFGPPGVLGPDYSTSNARAASGFGAVWTPFSRRGRLFSVEQITKMSTRCSR